MEGQRASGSSSFRLGAGALGVLLLLLGGLAVAAPFVAGLALDLVFGAVLVAAGAIQIGYAVVGRGTPRVGIAALLGVLAIVAGGLLLLRPVIGLYALTLVVGGYFLVHGVLELFAAAQWRRKGLPFGGMLVAGILGLFLGAVILFGWPITGLFAVGLLLAAHLVVVGLGLLFAALAGAPAEHGRMPTATRSPAHA